MKKLIIITGFLMAGFLTAPVKAQNVLDGIYIKEHIPERRPIPYTHLREADVLWSKRIWRVIDLREKINHPLYYPLDPTNGRKSLFDVIKDGVKEGTIIPFSNSGDDFKMQLTAEEALAKLETVRMKQTEDPDNPGSYFEVSDTDRIDSRKIIAYWVKEDWFIDRQRSVLDVRIVGIAPIYMTYDEVSGAEKGPAMLFWLYYPNLREVLAKNDVFNPFNDSERMSFDDLFWKRRFSSFVRKESNVYDRLIGDYSKGIDALLESERIKDEIFNLEHDMWHF